MKTATKKQEIIDVGRAQTPEELAVQQEGLTAQEFLAGMGRFYEKADDLEARAKTTLERAKLLKPPTSMLEDEDVQLLVKQAGTEKKEIVAHWSVRAVFRKINEALMAREKRGVGAAELAIQIGTNLHNDYVRAEQRRAAEEQERVRREAEEKARLEQEQKAAALEAEALKREAESADLSEREQAFVTLFCGGTVALAAARQAGYKNPAQTAEKLLGTPKIQAAIKAKQDAAALRQQATARREQPLEVQVETVRPEVSKVVSHDRTTKSAEITDAAAFVAAALKPGNPYNIPADTLAPVQKVLSDYARQMGKLIEKWPGVKYVEKTGIV